LFIFFSLAPLLLRSPAREKGSRERRRKK